MLEAYIRPEGRVDFEEAKFPFIWKVNEEETMMGIINQYELSKTSIWGEAPYHRFHQYLITRHN